MKPENVIKKLEKENPDAITWDDCDAALVGTKGDPPIAVYSHDKLVEVFMDQGMSYEDALDWVSFNIEGAYVGEFTPHIRYSRGL